MKYLNKKITVYLKNNMSVEGICVLDTNECMSLEQPNATCNIDIFFPKDNIVLIKVFKTNEKIENLEPFKLPPSADLELEKIDVNDLKTDLGLKKLADLKKLKNQITIDSLAKEMNKFHVSKPIEYTEVYQHPGLFKKE